ncbi:MULTISPECIES: hypothetical protein [unclassified Microcoleus]|nr:MULTISPECIES: hypothetical protein [unclassified Microcoleus]
MVLASAIAAEYLERNCDAPSIAVLEYITDKMGHYGGWADFR